MALSAAAQDTGLLRYHAVIIWLLSGVKQTKEATEAARYLQARLEVKIGTAGALRPQHQHPLHYARIRGWSRDGRTAGAHDATAEGPACRRT